MNGYVPVSAENQPSFGDEVRYLQTCRGGYGFQRWVPARWIGRTGAKAKRYAIQVTPANAPDQRKTIHVSPHNVFIKSPAPASEGRGAQKP